MGIPFKSLALNISVQKRVQVFFKFSHIFKVLVKFDVIIRPKVKIWNNPVQSSSHQTFPRCWELIPVEILVGWRFFREVRETCFSMVTPTDDQEGNDSKHCQRHNRLLSLSLDLYPSVQKLATRWRP